MKNKNVCFTVELKTTFIRGRTIRAASDESKLARRLPETFIIPYKSLNEFFIHNSANLNVSGPLVNASNATMAFRITGSAISITFSNYYPLNKSSISW